MKNQNEKTFEKNSVIEHRGGNTTEERIASAFLRLYEIIRILRAPGGCPWDREQTPLSMRGDLIEETFEAVDAITQQDKLHIKEELGDVFLNVTMIAYMFEQSDDFFINDLLDELVDKLIRRHPHVFETSKGKSVVTKQVTTSTEVLTQWDKIKEQVEGRVQNSILDEVPKGFPPLLKAFKLQKKAAKKGFDWDNINDVVTKVKEELQEVEAASTPDAHTTKTQAHLEEEIGDLLFSVVNYARKLGVDPECALTRTNQKFYNRFSYVEKCMEEKNISMEQKNLKTMDSFWNEAKRKGF